jgi:hypothetical protein
MNSKTVFLMSLLTFFLLPIALEYRVEPLIATEGSKDYLSLADYQVIFLGITYIEPPPGSMLEKYRGRTTAQRGIFVRSVFPFWLGIILGIILPVLIWSAALFKLFRIKKAKSKI